MKKTIDSNYLYSHSYSAVIMPVPIHQVQSSLERLIVETAQQSDAVVFGGHVRDKIWHDAAADEFYKYYEKDIERSVFAASNDMDVAYADKDYHPSSYAGRIHCSKDIDVFFPDIDNVIKFKKLLAKNHMWFSISSTRRANQYGFESGATGVLVQTLNVAYWAPMCLRSEPQFANSSVKVDIVTGPTGSAPPFGRIDLACNGLLLTADNEFQLMKSLLSEYEPNQRGTPMTPMQKLDKLNKIIGDIKEKKTQLINPTVDDIRITKLLNEGWQVSGSAFTALECLNKPDDKCFVCLDDFESTTDSAVNIKMTCCKGHMHAKCAGRWIQNAHSHDVCPRCGTSDGFDLSDEDRKLAMPGVYTKVAKKVITQTVHVTAHGNVFREY